MEVFKFNFREVSIMKRIVIFAVIIMLIGGLLAGCGGGTNPTSPKPKTSNVTVTVKDETGNPISSVSLTMGDYSGKTGNDGKYVFNDVKPGDYTVEATKEGYEDGSEDITVTAGEDKNITLTLKKVQQAEELKDYSTVKSYKVVIEVKSNNSNEIDRVIVVRDNYGKSEDVTAYENNKKKFELCKVGDKAKILSEGYWIEVPADQIGSLTSAYLDPFTGMVDIVRSRYNEWVKTPNGSASYSVKRVGRETVNGYSTTKYHFSGKVSSEGEKLVGEADIWIINKGPYKGYMTRMVATSSSSEGGKATYTINATDFGKDMEIKMP